MTAASGTHSTEPWRLALAAPDGEDRETRSAVEDKWGHIVAPSVENADAARIVACVNACAGVDTTVLTPTVVATLFEIVAAVDKLLTQPGALVDEHFRAALAPGVDKLRKVRRA